jgi:putative flavoprotein involved in K+ transport
MSRALATRSIEHVVLERGKVANAWRTERWDSLRLLTPNWLSRLPGSPYTGHDPDGYMRVHEVIDFISAYAESIAAPVKTATNVLSVAPSGAGYRVITNRGDWYCRAVVMASGAFNVPSVPRFAGEVPDSVRQLTANVYRNPDDLGNEGVLVVGGSATGVQLAEEIRRSGRPVTLATGEHVRMPRIYRGRDIQYWMYATGLLDQRIEETDDPRRARRVPSPQLIGSPGHRTLDLNALRELGVRITGRLAGIRGNKALFSGSLRNVCALADLKMNRLLDAIDEWVDRNGVDAGGCAGERFAPTEVDDSPALDVELGSQIGTIVWATGFRPDYSWLHAPAFDARGNLKHDGGIAHFPGLYVLGLPYLRRRKSSFIHGAEDDVRELSGHLAGFLERTAPRVFSGRSPESGMPRKMPA